MEQRHSPRPFVRPGHHPDRRQSAANFDIGNQYAGTANNVGGNQYLINQRENFLREVAATKTKARYLIGIGFGLAVVGFALFGGSVFSFIGQVMSSMKEQSDAFDESWNTGAPPEHFPGSDIPGFNMPMVIGGFSLFAIGGLLILVGIVLHVVATSRRKRVEQEFRR